MEMSNLIAYIPTLNQRHLDWFGRHPNSNLLLISQEEAEEFLPRLARNMAALPTEVVASMISSLNVARVIRKNCSVWCGEFVLPDEDVSHLFADKYLYPADCKATFEMIWARYDMTAVIRDQPVIPDVEVSCSDFDARFMDRALRLSKKSPDWWRQIGAVAVSSDGEFVAAAHNTHMPNEYETYIFGDPGLNRDAGQPGKYTALHAEAAVVARCARFKEFSLSGASLYVTTFPCEGCAHLIVASGITKVFFREGFSSLNAQDTLRTHGVEIVQLVDNSGVV